MAGVGDRGCPWCGREGGGLESGAPFETRRLLKSSINQFYKLRSTIMTNKLSMQMGFQNGDAGGHVAAGMQAVRNPFGRRTSISSLSQAELASTASRDAGKTAGESRDEGDEGRNSAAAANTNHNHDGVEDGTTLPRASLPCAAGGPVILSLNEARRERNKNTIARRSSTKGVAPEATMRIRRRSSTQGVLPETMSITRRISTKGVTPAAAVGISRRSSTKGL